MRYLLYAHVHVYTLKLLKYRSWGSKSVLIEEFYSILKL